MVRFVDMSHQLDDDNTDENKIAAESLIASLGVNTRQFYT